MTSSINQIPLFVERIKSLKDTIITNIILTGQIPAPTFEEGQRAEMLLERFSHAGLERCTPDTIGNPVAVLPGRSADKPPIFVVAHLDTVVDREVDHNYTITRNSIQGPGIADNSTGVGVLASLPDIFAGLGLSFESDIVLAGVVRSIGDGNLEGIKTLVKNWGTPIRGAISLEACELGRLSYFSEGLKRCEIECSISPGLGVKQRFLPNAILVLNEVINQILELRLPQRPRARIIVGRISGGIKHGTIPFDASLGLEIQSDSVEMVRSVYADIKDIVNGVAHEQQAVLKLKSISEQAPSRLKFSHPLVKSAIAVMKKLKLEPVTVPSESELSVFLSHNIPAITLGLTHGTDAFLPEHSTVKISPLFKGIAQVIGVLSAIDSGVCDE
jgi:acetylornithine deacetylase/succinyl-diaminopimelate desuccinylase-like protein